MIVIEKPFSHSDHRVIRIGEENWKEFQQLVQRGANLWPDASPTMKKFADEVTVGHAQQDYERMNDRKMGRTEDANKPDIVYSHWCVDCGNFTQQIAKEPPVSVKCTTCNLTNLYSETSK